MKNRVLLLASSMLALTAVSPAFAQAADSAVPSNDDIIVTATRSETLLSKTPIALTAIGGGDLIRAGITNPTQLVDAVPNLSIVRGNGLQITIRGVTSTDGTEKGDPSAAFMLDGVYLARPQAQEVSFFDIERVEVLRGPQGTLYGRNSTAGVINVLSTRPKFQFGGSLDASYGNYNAVNLTGVINVPLGDTFALRLAANMDRRNSYIIDGNAGDGVKFDPFKDNKTVRLSALFKPNDDFSMLVVGDYSSIRGNPTNGVPVQNFYSNITAATTGPRAAFNAPTFLYPDATAARVLRTAQAQQAGRHNSTGGVMTEINYGTGPVSLTYIGSYRRMKTQEYSTLNLGAVGSDFVGRYWQTSHELRLAYNSGPLQAQVGGYYFKEKSGIAFFINNLLGPNTRFGFPQDPTIAENKSVFGQATLEIAPQLKITAGARYSHDLKSRIGNTVLDTYTALPNSYNVGTFVSRAVFQNNNASRTFSKVTWRAGIDYDTDLGLIYASVSTGYKAGGFNDGCEQPPAGQPNPQGCSLPANILYYDPENLTAYEAGFKFRLSQEFRLNGTAFHYDYKGLQLSSLGNCAPPGQPVAQCQVTQNAAAAKVDGVELEARIAPVNNFNVRLSLNYLDAKYKTFSPVPAVNLANYPLTRSPKWSWIAGANWTVPVGEGKIVADGQVSFRSRQELTDLTNYGYFFMPAYTRTDLSLTYSAPGDRFYLAAFVQNLENNLVVTGAGAGQSGATAGTNGAVTFADPRLIGARAGFKF